MSADRERELLLRLEAEVRRLVGPAYRAEHNRIREVLDALDKARGTDR